MSTDIYEDSDVIITQYNGGDKGISVQITQKDEINSYIQMHRKTAYRLCKQLEKWIKDTEEEGFIQDI